MKKLIALMLALLTLMTMLTGCKEEELPPDDTTGGEDLQMLLPLESLVSNGGN